MGAAGLQLQALSDLPAHRLSCTAGVLQLQGLRRAWQVMGPPHVHHRAVPACAAGLGLGRDAQWRPRRSAHAPLTCTPLRRKDMVKAGVLYGGRESYHHMCRYFSGFFFRHPILAEFDYYWRMEPDVHYYCDLDYDPFLFMQARC